jgi:hypothetical protein
MKLRVPGVQLGAPKSGPTRCVVGGCAARATGSYLSRPTAVQFPHVSTVPLALLWAFRPGKGFSMTPQFLRSEAARFREMAESLTDREASRQRKLAKAVDNDKRAEQAEQFQPHEQMQAAETEPAPEGVNESEPGGTGRSSSTRLRLSRTTGASTAPGKLGV